MNSGPVVFSPEVVQFDDPASSIRFGMIALATDRTSERDIYRQLPDKRVSIHVTRVAFENPATPDNLRRMGPRLRDAAALLVPIAPFHAVYYSCTAASAVIGEDNVAASIRQELPGVPIVTPTLAARRAFQALGVSRIAVLTPYTIMTSAPVADYFTHHGLEIARFHCLGIEDDRDMARVNAGTILGAATSADNSDAAALFVSCTALPVVGLVPEIEQRIGKPVVTSNQAAAWMMSHLGGLVTVNPSQFGALFQCDLPPHKAGEVA